MRYIKINENKKVVSIRFGSSIVEDEIQSDTGNIGQIMQSDGTFIDDVVIIVPQPYVTTNTEIAQMISDLQADLMIAGVI